VSAEANRLGRNFGYVWSAAGCSNLGDGIVKIALPLLAVQLTDSPAGVAGVAVASYLPWILLALPAGALADRVDRRNAMRSVNVVRATVVGGLAVVATNDLGGLTVVYVAAFVLGAGETLFDTSAQSLLPAIVDRGLARPEGGFRASPSARRSEAPPKPRTTLTKANSRLFALEQTTNEFIGPPLGGWLTGLGIAFSLATSSALFFVAAALLSMLTGSYRMTRPVEATMRAEIVEGVRFLYDKLLLRTTVIIVAILNFVGMAALAVLPLYAVEPGPLDLSEFGYGLLLLGFGLGGLIGSTVAESLQRRFGRARVLVGAVAADGVWLVALALTRNVAVIGLAMVLSGVGIMSLNVVGITFRQLITPARLLGRVVAAHRVVVLGILPLGAAAGGAVAEVVALQVLFGLCAAVSLAMVLPAAFFWRDEAMDAEEATADVGGPESV
jgi:MFS family permease